MGQTDRMPSWVRERKRVIIAERWCCAAPTGSGSLRRLCLPAVPTTARS